MSFSIKSSYQAPRISTPKTQRPILNQEIIQQIRIAAHDLKMLRIVYAGASGTSMRDIEPYEIKEQHLWAYCYTAGDVRQFSLHNIISAEITDVKFRPRWPVKIV